MQLRARLPSIVLPLVLAVAAGGYLAGLHRPPLDVVQEPLQEARSASAPGITLERPRDWVRSEAGPAVPGLPLQSPLWLRPGSGPGAARSVAAESGAAGPGAAGPLAVLLAGMLPLQAGSPLPVSLLGRLRSLPQTEVVDLDAGQALRYRAKLRGSDETLELYVLPARASDATVLVCEGPAAAAASLRECERIAATVAPQAQPAGDLTPDPQYAARLSALIAGLLPGPARAQTALASWAPAAGRRFVAAARRLALLEPPPVAAAAQTQLTAALSLAGLAYARLGAAARLRSRRSYEAARGELAGASRELQAALRTYALLGYRRS